MADLQVTCVDKSGPTHEHITQIGGAGWKKTRETAVAEIKSRTNSFYVVDSSNGKRAVVEIYKEIYLRTKADGDWKDNLLSLGKCS